MKKPTLTSFLNLNYLIVLFSLLLHHTAFAQSFNEIIKAVASDRWFGDEFGFTVSISGDYAIVGASSEDEDISGANTLAHAGSAYLFERDGSGNWAEKQKIVGSHRGTGYLFGYSVSISGDYAIIGAHGDSEDANGINVLYMAGAAYLFERDGSGNWAEKQKIVASDREASDQFGVSVSISGDYAIVGARYEDEDASGANTINAAGSAYLFERDGTGNWVEKQKIVASDRGSPDLFGYSVSISGDYAIVGAYDEDEDTNGINTLSNAGSAYLFERDGSGNWAEKQKIVASDRGAEDLFGYSVSISGDYAIVGAHGDSEDTSGANALFYAGSAYLFERDGSGNWAEKQKIVASDRGVSDEFGRSVSISGEFAIVGAYIEAEDASGANTLAAAGSAYLFERDGSGNWAEKQKIVASDREAGDYFGRSVSISGDHAIIGAYHESEDTSGANTLAAAGSAYLFEVITHIGITENNLASQVAIYPNPNNGVFTVSINGTYAKSHIIILDVVGKSVYQKIVTKQQNNVTLSGLQNGVYFITIKNGTQTVTQKIIKQ